MHGDESAPGSRVAEELTAVVRLAEANVADDGGPFAAVVVLADGRRFTGTNRVATTYDPSAHAEVVAIRAACRETASVALEGAVLYASCEPCPMCLAVALWARVGAVHHAADRHDAARAGFDDAVFHDYFADPASRELMPVAQCRVPQAAAPFAAWERSPGRRPY